MGSNDIPVTKAQADMYLQPATGYNWTGLNPAQIKNIATAMARSGMFPDIERDVPKAFVKIMAGQEMGLAPFQAMSDISIIEGKAAAGGNIYASKVKSNPRYDYRVRQWDTSGCAIEFFEYVDGKRESLGTSTFEKQDAQAAGLLDPECPDPPIKHNIRLISRFNKWKKTWEEREGCNCKDSWKKYPRNMYFNRAMSGGVRTFCPDALNGVNAYTPEELGANVNEDGSFVSMDDQPASTAKGDAPEAKVVGTEPNHEQDIVDDYAAQQAAAVSDEDVQELKAEMQTDVQADQTPEPMWVVPHFKPSKMVQVPQLKLITKWLEHYATIRPDLAKTFVNTFIGKDRPGTYDEAMLVLNNLAEELNAIEEQGEVAA